MGSRANEMAGVVAAGAATALAVIFTITYWGKDPGWALFPLFLWGGTLVSVLAHELGHLVAGMALGGHARSVDIGVRPGPGGFRIGSVTVRVGWRVTGRVLWATRPRHVWPMYAGGPGANLALALAMGVAIKHAVIAQPIAYGILLASLYLGVANLVPHRVRNGLYSDGAHMFGTVPASANPLGPPGTRSRTLIEPLSPPTVRTAALDPDGRAKAVGTVRMVCWLSLTAVTIPAAELRATEKRIAWLVENAPRTPQIVSVLALFELRAGRPAQAAELSREALAGLTAPAERASAYALAALAAHALGESPHADLRQAVGLDRTADLVREALVATQPGSEPTVAQQDSPDPGAPAAVGGEG